jgi:L-asparaginase / beta-aspartyl-peptidase
MRSSLLLAALALMSAASAQAAEGWTLVIHGGAGVLERSAMTPERDKETRAALNRALAAGGAILDKGGSSLDAVEAAVKVLEDDPHFNAGKGAVFTYEGKNELDAAIMDGRDRKAGAVAGVTHTKSPIALARAVMEKSPHVFMSGEGANRFAKDIGAEQVDPSYFRTEERWQQLQKLKSQGANYFDVDLKYGTVGAVARDAKGNLAAATSTGGLTGKRWGRIGDAPVIGAGTYADNRACAVSATGAGEFYIRAGVAHEICARMRFLKEGPKAAADAVQAETKALGGDGGVIVVAADGTPAWSFNTPGMYRGMLRAGEKPVVGIYGDED